MLKKIKSIFIPGIDYDTLMKVSNFTSIVNIKIDSIIISLRSNDSDFSSYIKKNYLEFVTSEQPNYIINIHKNIKGLSWPLQLEGGYKYDLIEFDEKFFFRQNILKTELDLILPENYKDWEIDNFFKLYFSGISIKHNMLLLHASAIIRNDKAILFSGPSGAGKSTIANLSGYPIIHDDIISITYLGERKFCLQTIPFKVNYKRVIFRGEVEGFYRICQSENTLIKDVVIQEKLVLLLYSVWNFDKFKLQNENLEEQITDYCLQIMANVEVKKLYFSKSTDFLKFI